MAATSGHRAPLLRRRYHSGVGPVRGVPWCRLAAAWLALGCAGAPAVAQLPARLLPAEFAALVERLSEPSAYFDTDNLVSNEDSYLHAVTGLRRHGVSGGAYLGVGPDQNFSYVAAIRPEMAFILDIRRDNLLEHLLFKGIFTLARNRMEYLCLLFGTPLPRDTAGWAARDLAALLEHVTDTRPDSAAAAGARRRVRSALLSSGIPLSPRDVQTIARFHDTFITLGPELRLTTFGRPARRDYPSYRELLLGTDLEGRRANFLAGESDFQFVRALQARNLIVPLVGDFAGPKTLKGVGRYLEERGARVSAFYTSNVEQYLFGDGSFTRFAGNVAALPHDERSVIIRSYFPYGRPHPHAVSGYLSIQLLQRVTALLGAQRTGGYRGYVDLVTREVLSPR